MGKVINTIPVVLFTVGLATAQYAFGAATAPVAAPPPVEASQPADAVPAELAFDGIPQMGDHYLCYDVINKPWSATVVVKDQFGKFDFVINSISRLCNPVEKNYKGKTTPITKPALHYVCYRGKTHVIGRTVQINNQFGPAVLNVRGPTEICLPSVKYYKPTGKEKD